MISICDSNEKRGQAYCAALIKELGVEAHLVKDPETVIGFFDLLPDLELVIAPSPEARLIASKIRNRDIQLISFGGELIKGEYVEHLSTEPTVRQLVRRVKDKIKENTEDDYFSVPIRLLKGLRFYPCDFYIYIDEKFIKYKNKDDELVHADLEKLAAQSRFLLHIKFSDSSLFFEKMFSVITKDYPIGTEGMTPKDLSFNLLDSIGIKSGEIKNALKLNDESIRQILKDDIFSFLKDLSDQTKLNFLQKHAYLTSVLCHMILSTQKWALPIHYMNTSMAAFLMDRKLETKGEVLTRCAKKCDKERILNHAAVAAQEVSGIKGVPQEVVNMVRSHHGKSDGKGFPDGSIDPSLNKLSRFFMFCESLSASILRDPMNPWSLEDFELEMNEKFGQDSFSQLIKVMNWYLH